MEPQIQTLTRDVLSYSAHEDLSQLVPTFADVVTSELNASLRSRWNTRTVRLQLNSSGSETYLPSDFLEAKQILLDGRDLEYATPEQQALMLEGYCDTPTYTVYADKIRIVPSQPARLYQRQQGFGYSLAAVITPIDSDGPEPLIRLSLSWTPDNTLDPDTEGRIHIKRTNRYTGDETEQTYNVLESSPYEADIPQVNFMQFVYDVYYEDGTDRSNLIRIDLLNEEEPIQTYETHYDMTILAGPPLDLIYYSKLPPLSRYESDGVTETERNKLYDAFPSLYLFGTLAQAFAYLMEPQKEIMWRDKFIEQLTVIQKRDNTGQYGGGTLKTRIR